VSSARYLGSLHGFRGEGRRAPQRYSLENLEEERQTADRLEPRPAQLVTALVLNLGHGSYPAHPRRDRQAAFRRRW
jgi:hypothetical protein